MSENEFYSYTRESLLELTNGKPIIHGHTPLEIIYFDGVRLNCDLGSNTYSVIEERALALVNLSLMEYFKYKPSTKRIETHKVIRI
ncbi:hypothetical protein [Cohnella abietis]|uniref:Calcineurin-like phosphoesterase domain-containing protein n=1 Tax=Cohnella abietis TaxID=2507935 RepID=A0A3T1DAM9_9BACL|nr:hypothetical protein [Cohnella abietis]BBI35161.1 hypothetical protein KCTCHS21_45600 [Cohnella abietis]